MRPLRDLHETTAARRSAGHSVQPGTSPDNDGMSARTIVPLNSPGRAVPIEGPPTTDLDQAGSDLHLVEPGRPEQADPQQQRRAFQGRCAEIAHLLARTRRFDDRMELYRRGGFTWHELSTAAALYPELMPRLNDEWEWIVLTLADYEDD
jgi:hypothetical protein